MRSIPLLSQQLADRPAGEGAAVAMIQVTLDTIATGSLATATARGAVTFAAGLNPRHQHVAGFAAGERRGVVCPGRLVTLDAAHRGMATMTEPAVRQPT